MKRINHIWLGNRNSLFASCFIFTVAGLTLACKPDADYNVSKLANDQVTIEIMLEDEDLNFIERSSLQAFLICNGAEKRYQAIVRNNRTAALRGLSFRTDQEVQPGTNCQVEVTGSPRSRNRRNEAPIVEWLSQGRVENLLFISKPAPIMTDDKAPAGLGKGYLTTIFYKTFMVLKSQDPSEILPSELISKDRLDSNVTEEVIAL